MRSRTEHPARVPHAKARLAVLVTAALWASAFVGVRVALPHYPPGHLALLRYLVAAGVLLVVAPLAGVRLPSRRDLPGIFLTGVVGIATYNVLLNTGQRSVTAAAASMIVNGVPVLTALLSATFLGERMGARGWLGLTVSFAGTAIIASTGQDGFHFERGAMLLLLAALAMSVYFVLQKPFLRRYSPLAMVTYAIWSGALCLLVFLPGLGTSVMTAPPGATLAVIYLGIFPAAVAYVAYSYALSVMPAGRTASFLYFVPVLTIVIAWLWLREAPALRTLLGGGVVMSGVLLVNARTRARGTTVRPTAPDPTP
jgi:drug/metabolite transporter (DMT)-like permease